MDRRKPRRNPFGREVAISDLCRSWSPNAVLGRMHTVRDALHRRDPILTPLSRSARVLWTRYYNPPSHRRSSSLWQDYRESGPLIQLTLHGDRALHLLDNVLDDRKTQARAAHLARPGLIHAIEALEDPRQILGRNPDAAVGDADGHLASGHAARLHPDFAAPAVEFDRVVEQVDKRLLQLDLVAHHLQVLHGDPPAWPPRIRPCAWPPPTWPARTVCPGPPAPGRTPAPIA